MGTLVVVAGIAQHQGLELVHGPVRKEAVRQVAIAVLGPRRKRVGFLRIPPGTPSAVNRHAHLLAHLRLAVGVEEFEPHFDLAVLPSIGTRVRITLKHLTAGVEHTRAHANEVAVLEIEVRSRGRQRDDGQVMRDPEKITAQRLRTGTRLEVGLGPNHHGSLDANRTHPRRRNHRHRVAIGRVANQSVGRGPAQFQYHFGPRGVEARIDREHRRRQRRPHRSGPIGSGRRGLRFGIHHPLPGLEIGWTAERLVRPEARHGYLIDRSSEGIAQCQGLTGGIDAKIRMQLVGRPQAVETRGINHEGFTGLNPPFRETPSPWFQRVVGEAKSPERYGPILRVEHLDPIPERPRGIREDRRVVAHHLGDLQQSGGVSFGQDPIEERWRCRRWRNEHLEPPRCQLAHRGCRIQRPHHWGLPPCGDLHPMGLCVDGISGEPESDPSRGGPLERLAQDDRRLRCLSPEPRGNGGGPKDRSKPPPEWSMRHNRLSNFLARRIQTAFRFFSNAGE